MSDEAPKVDCSASVGVDNVPRPSAAAVDMDDILGAALDELEEEEDANEKSTMSSTDPKSLQSTPAATAVADGTSHNVDSDKSDEAQFLEQLNGMMQDLTAAANGGEDTALDNVMAKLQLQMASEIQRIQQEDQSLINDQTASSSTTRTDTTNVATGAPEEQQGDAKNKRVEPRKKRPVFGPEPPPVEQDVDTTISKLLEGMAASASDAAIPNNDDEDDLLKELENLGAGGEDVLDGMMQQLLTKELMLEPLKQVHEKFPSWLENNRSKLSKDEYINRSKQVDSFRKLIQLYETEPDNTERLMDAMKEIQDYGLPPSEIVSEIAPGLELDSDGVPKLNPEDCSIL